MKLLLDTHALLWFLGGDSRLSEPSRLAVEDLENTRHCSIATAWEIAIKVSLGKLQLVVPFEELIPGQLQSNGIDLLPVSPAHLQALLGLPFHHRDPFDRLLVAQAQVEGASIISVDSALDDYGVRRLW